MLGLNNILSKGLRFIVCDGQEETKIVTDYCLEKGLEFNVVEQTNVGSMREDEGPDPMIVWYIGRQSDQIELVKRSAGAVLF